MVVIHVTPCPCVPNIFRCNTVKQHMKMPPAPFTNTDTEYILDISATALCDTAQALNVIIRFLTTE